MKHSKVLLLLIPAIIYIACSHKPKNEDERLNDPRVVLQVGDSKLTLGEIETKMGSKAEYRDAADEYNRKKAVVDRSLDQFLLVEGAKKEGFTATVDSSTITRSLLRAYYGDKILNKVKVGDKDIEEFFKKYGGQVQVGHIQVADSALAESLYTLIKNGGDFEELAKKFSQERVSRDNGGSIGYRDYSGLTQYGDKFCDAAFSMKAGEISHPVQSRLGWHVIKAFDRIKNTKEFLDQDKNRYHDITFQYLQRKRVGEFVDQVKKDNHYEVVKPTLTMLIQKSDSIKAAGIKQPGLKSAAYLDSTILDNAQKDMFIIAYDGGGVKVRDLLNLFATYDPTHLPDLQDNFVMGQIYEGLAMPALLIKLAAKEGFDKTPKFKKDMENSRGVLLAQKMRDKIYKGTSDVSEQEIKDYYDSHRDEFYMPKSLRVAAIAAKTEAEANDLLARVKSGASFAALAKQYSVDKETGANGGDLGFFTGDQRLSKYPEIYAAGANLKPGDLGGPVQMRSNWWIFKVTQWLESTPKGLDLVKSDIMSRISSQRRTATYKSWVDQAKKDYPITMNLDLIKNNLKSGSYTDTTTSNSSGRQENK